MYKIFLVQGSPINTTGNQCRLLTRVEPDPIPGWTAYNFGNWAEPDQWKNGNSSYYKCYEKGNTAEFPICKNTKKFMHIRNTFIF